MPRFPVAFGRRRSTVTDDFQNVPVTEGSSFRVLERSEVATGKSFEGGAKGSRLSRAPNSFPLPAMQPMAQVGIGEFRTDQKTLAADFLEH